MSRWIEEPCKELLRQLNDVPFTDEREKIQLEIVINGLFNINRNMMKRAAERTRNEFGADSGSSPKSTVKQAPKPVTESKPKKAVSEPSKVAENEIDPISPNFLDDFDAFDAELDMIEQTLIRSIGD